jgi:hypothetical protein
MLVATVEPWEISFSSESKSSSLVWPSCPAAASRLPKKPDWKSSAGEDRALP